MMFEQVYLLILFLLAPLFIQAQTVHIPDSNFKAALIANYSININGDQVVVTLTGETSAHQLQLLLSHPLESDRDFEAVLIRSGPGEYRGRLQHAVAARWHWTLEDRGMAPWRLDGTLGSDDLGD